MPKREDMGFDLEGRPLPMASGDVHRMVMRALDDPNSELVAFILRKDGDLMLQVMGPPTRETLKDIEQALRTLVTGYAHILKGQ